MITLRLSQDYGRQRCASRWAAAPLLAVAALFLALTQPVPPLRAQGGAAPEPAGASAARPELDLQVGHNGGVSVVAFFPDGKTVASAGGDQIKLWDASTGTLQRTLTGHHKARHSLRTGLLRRSVGKASHG